MFKIGDTYIIKLWGPGPNGGVVSENNDCKVIEVTMPVIKIRQGEKEIILNTGSAAFISAEIQPPHLIKRPPTTT